jgi:hypothetical protein
LENSNIRHNNEFYNNNLYRGNDTFKPIEDEDTNNDFESDIKTPQNDYNKFDNANGNSQKSENSSVKSFLSESDDEMDFSLKTTIAHLRGDLVYSVGVFISAVIINIRPDWRFFDSICTFLFSYVALELTIPIFTESMRILLEGSAEGKFEYFFNWRSGC